VLKVLRARERGEMGIIEEPMKKRKQEEEQVIEFEGPKEPYMDDNLPF
jgi:hypothetical protein